MNILKYKIVKQTNGKFALWDAAAQEFSFINYDSPDELKDYLVDKTNRILVENILTYAQDDTHFKLCSKSYKIKYGLDLSPRDEAVAALKKMGESVEGI